MAIAPHPSLTLTPFSADHARVIAAWVASPAELFHLAPQTSPPLTPAKVLAWREAGGCPLLLAGLDGQPLAYAELNPMPRDPDQNWLGHVVVAPAVRGRGLGTAFLRLLLNEAFLHRAMRRVSLVVFPDNRAAIRCYEKVGFVDVGAQVRRFITTGRQHALRHLVIDRKDYLRTPSY